MSAEHTPQPQSQPFGSGPGHHQPAPHGPQHRYEPSRQPQPVQIGKALVILFLVRILILLVQGLGMGLVYWVLGVIGPDSSLLYATIGLGESFLALVGGAVWMTCLVLGIVVVVRSHGQLRTGAILVLVALVVSTLFSVEVSGSFGSGGVGDVLRILDLAFDLLTLAVSAVAAFFLVRGHRTAAQAEGSRNARY